MTTIQSISLAETIKLFRKDYTPIYMYQSMDIKKKLINTDLLRILIHNSIILNAK